MRQGPRLKSSGVDTEATCRARRGHLLELIHKFVRSHVVNTLGDRRRDAIGTSCFNLSHRAIFSIAISSFSFSPVDGHYRPHEHYLGANATSSRIAINFRPGCARTSHSPGGIEEYYDDLQVPATVHINEIIEALEMQFDESLSYLDLDAGQVVTVSEDLLCEAEEPGGEQPDLADWQKDEWEIAKQIVSTDRFRPLPTKFDVHEWGIMQEFSRSVESEEIGDEISRAIHGPGAFRNFKDTVRRLGIESAWFAFRADAIRQIAIDWCEENQIAWQ